MKVKHIVFEDFVNYKKPSMFIAFPYCSFKCEKDCGLKCCQNSDLALMPIVEVDIDSIVTKYIDNPITKAIVCGGLEPFDSFNDLLDLIKNVRVTHNCNDDIVVYTGYKEDELQKELSLLAYDNIYIKFGRFVPGQEKHFDELLGVNLASQNQYGKKIEV